MYSVCHQPGCSLHLSYQSLLCPRLIPSLQAVLPVRQAAGTAWQGPGLSRDGTDSGAAYRRGGGEMLATFLGMIYTSSLSYFPSSFLLVLRCLFSVSNRVSGPYQKNESGDLF